MPYSLQPRDWTSQTPSTVAIREVTLGLWATHKFLAGVPAVLGGTDVPEHMMFDRYIKTWSFHTRTQRYQKTKPNTEKMGPA